MKKLAINGGDAVRKNPLPVYKVMGEEEAKAAYDVVMSGVLSKFLGCWDDDFFGGEQVTAFEREMGGKVSGKTCDYRELEQFGNILRDRRSGHRSRRRGDRVSLYDVDFGGGTDFLWSSSCFC